VGGNPIVIDGSHGEGGGQILRTSLGLAAARAATAVCNAEIIEKLAGRKISIRAPNRTPREPRGILLGALSSKPPDEGLVKIEEA